MRKEKGLSQIELIITLSIAMLLASASFSTFTSAIHQLRIDLACSEFIRVLALARSEAVKRNTRVTVSNSDDQWEDGWIVFVDSNNNASHDPDEAILLVGESTSQWLTMRGNSTVKTFVSYAPAGYAAQTNNAWQAGSLTVCPTQPKTHGYKIIINRGGRVRQEKMTCET